MRKLLISLALALVLTLGMAIPAYAATDADVTVTATPSYVAITDNATSYDFGTVAESATPSTATTYVGITNTSSVITNNTVGVTTTTWAGGVTWAHAEDAVPGSNLAGLKANKGGTWGTGDVVVRNGTPLNLAASQAANTNWSYGLKLWAPTVFTDGVQKSIIVRITATAV